VAGPPLKVVVWRGAVLAARAGMAIEAVAACVIRPVGGVVRAKTRRGAGRVAVAPVEASRDERVAPEVGRHDESVQRGVEGASGVQRAPRAVLVRLLEDIFCLGSVAVVVAFTADCAPGTARPAAEREGAWNALPHASVGRICTRLTRRAGRASGGGEGTRRAVEATGHPGDVRVGAGATGPAGGGFGGAFGGVLTAGGTRQAVSRRVAAVGWVEGPRRARLPCHTRRRTWQVAGEREAGYVHVDQMLQVDMDMDGNRWR